jgi:hypothetical protein
VSVFTNENTELNPTPQSTTPETPLQLLEITEKDVLKKLTKLNSSKSPGPDAMHPRVLRELGSTISKPLAIIMTKSLEEGVLPHGWKTANVTPIYKKGPKSDCGNYHPVSLTRVVCKMMESLIRDHVMKYIDDNKLLSACQHGFVNGRSCSTQLMSCLEIWTEMLDTCGNLDVIYLDFAKAFDSVPHQRLLSKLTPYGITEEITVEQELPDRKTTKGTCSGKRCSIEAG